MISVNTNYGSLIALQQWGATNTQLEATQSRISTGLKIANAKDNGAVNAIAEGMRADLAGYGTVIQSLDRTVSTLDVALNAGEAIADILVEIKATTLAAADQAITAEQLDAYDAKFIVLRDQIKTIIDNADFNGVNLLDGSVTSLSALASSDGSQTIDVDAANLTFTTTFVSVDDYDDLIHFGGGIILIAENQTLQTMNDPSLAEVAIENIEASIDNLSGAMARLGTTARTLGMHREFIVSLSDNLDKGIGNLVDASLAKESAKLQALQTRQQLGVQALSIANSMPQIALSLFR